MLTRPSTRAALAKSSFHVLHTALRALQISRPLSAWNATVQQLCGRKTWTRKHSTAGDRANEANSPRQHSQQPRCSTKIIRRGYAARVSILTVTYVKCKATKQYPLGMRNTRTCCGRRITSAGGSARSACILHAADAQRSVHGQARERRSTFDRGDAAHACELTVHDLIRFSVSTFPGGIVSTFSGGAQQERAKNTMHRLDLFL